MEMKEQLAYPKERIRYAVLSFFLAQGLCFSSWASRIPDVKAMFDVYDVFYWGLVLFLIPVGKFVAIPLAGFLVSRLGRSLDGLFNPFCWSRIFSGSPFIGTCGSRLSTSVLADIVTLHYPFQYLVFPASDIPQGTAIPPVCPSCFV